MIQKNYCFAGLALSVSLPEDMLWQEEAWLAPFVTDRVTEPHRYTFRRTETLPLPLGECLGTGSNARTYARGAQRMRFFGPRGGDPETAFYCVTHEGREHRVELLRRSHSGRLSVGTALDALDISMLVLNNRSVILHAAFLEWEGKAILFTAPSGTGKSTQAALWQRHRGARILNGDRAVIRLEQDRILAEGLPFCGSSGISENASLPLLAVVYLGQAPVSTIRKLRGYEAFARLWEGCVSDVWTGEEREKASGTLETLASRVPVYHMPCTPDEAAVVLLEKTLRKQERQ